ncbi:MAG: 4-hydroxy-tetrahydrodipicolinate synthase [Ruminococcaceae bacterium]|nr:4-hydroxy-tetrahydrodipicolinate synthase [Oscillospiraceae bacterium]
MTKRPVFTGAGVALVTPMHPDGQVNEAKLRELVEFQIAEGTDALIAVGTTGEASTLNMQEHMRVVEVVIEQANRRVPVIAGTGSNDTAHCMNSCRMAQKLGADGLLLVTPYYNKTSQRGLIAHYTQVATATDLPMILYNVPSRTGVNMLPETVATLYRTVDNVMGLKQANGDLASAAKVLSLCDIPLYSGNDNEITATLAIGGQGVISVLSNVVPRVVHDLCAAWFRGDPATCRQLQLHWLALANALFSDVNPIPVKAAMNLMGMAVGDCRLPLYTMEDKALEALREVLCRYQLIE